PPAPRADYPLTGKAPDIWGHGVKTAGGQQWFGLLPHPQDRSIAYHGLLLRGPDGAPVVDMHGMAAGPVVGPEQMVAKLRELAEVTLADPRVDGRKPVFFPACNVFLNTGPGPAFNP